MQLLLLHGAIGAADQLEPLRETLSADYTVHALNFPGHGGTKGDEFSIPAFASFVENYCEEQGLREIAIFGYSMGGYVALYLAKRRPDLVQNVITLATKFLWDEETAAKEKRMLVPEVIEEKLPKFAAALRGRHAPGDWKEVLARTSAMLEGLGADNALKPADYPSLQTRSLLLLGDRDKMVGLEETLEAFRSLPNAQLGILPETPHPIEAVPADLLATIIRRFLGSPASPHN